MTKKRNARISNLPTVESIEALHKETKSVRKKKAVKEKKRFGTRLNIEYISKLKIQAFNEGKTVSKLLEEILKKHFD